MQKFGHYFFAVIDILKNARDGCTELTFVCITEP